MSPSFYDWDAGAYAAARPSYPEALFEAIASRCPSRGWAWDCAAGSGQATQGLAGHFRRVVATDLSYGQLAATPEPRAAPRLVAAAETPPFRDGVFDLVAVGQALHWFANDAFFATVARVARGGRLACWNYGNVTVAGQAGNIVDHFYDDVVGAYWLPERDHIVNDFAGIEFPFAAHERIALRLECHWEPDDLLAYISTWSAVRRYRAAEDRDPIPDLTAELKATWPAGRRSVQWSLNLHLFDVP